MKNNGIENSVSSAVLQLRHATMTDLPAIHALFVQAQAYMFREGNIEQWRRLPARSVLEADIAKNELYVYTQSVAGEEVLEGTFVLQQGSVPAYEKIEQGTWPTKGPYVSLHRVVSSGHVKRLFDRMCAYAFTMADEVRIDTHEKNISMRRALRRNGFTYCGIIHLPDGGARRAYIGFYKEIS